MNPPRDLLEQYAPGHIWDLAEKQALRSPHRRHKVGAVIFYGMGGSDAPKVYSKGCSHSHAGGLSVNSIHAERDAISKMHGTCGGAVCLIVTLSRKDRWAGSSRPCEECAKALKPRVWGVIYAERTNDREWAVRSDSPERLMYGFLKPTKHKYNLNGVA